MECIPAASTYSGVEDMPKDKSDFNCNDDAFVLKGVSLIAALSEPVRLLLIGVGILGLAALGGLGNKKHS